MTDKVLLANGELIERTYFMKDLKVGDKLYGVQNLEGYHRNYNISERFKIVEVTIQKVGRKYAEFTESNSRNVKKMLLENGRYISDWVDNNLTFFKERDEADAYIQNQEMIKNAEDIIGKLKSRIDIELALRIQNAFPEY